MASLTEKQIAERLADGRGAGELASYKPFIDVHDFASSGLVSRIPSLKTGRIHHFFSQIESIAFLDLIRQPQVLDIREQFPLEREDTRTIAAEMGVEHPRYPNGVDVVMTTDILVSVRVGSEPTKYARAGKAVKDLTDRRVLEKLEIERRYWEKRGVHWGLVTDLDRSSDRATMLRWLHGMESLPEEHVPNYWVDRIATFRAQFTKARDITLDDFDRRLIRHGFQNGEMINVLRHLAWNGELTFDLDQPFDTKWPIRRVRRVTASWREIP